MAGAIPGRVYTEDRRVGLGYRVGQALGDNPLMAAGEIVKGHEFHWSRWEMRPGEGLPAYLRSSAPGGPIRGGLQGLDACMARLKGWIGAKTLHTSR